MPKTNPERESLIGLKNRIMQLKKQVDGNKQAGNPAALARAEAFQDLLDAHQTELRIRIEEMGSDA